ncbi:uncharacterized protein LOC110054376, partial [Orbicella faveolata]|uniref:uncharacterized protein LOC110054376 n=1 Tax=Orbicella faveolata TaxID=48498 RepID=UPI0009E3A59E
TGFNESNGKSFLEFFRKRDTGDKKDIEIKRGPMLLVYAYHSLDYPSPYKTEHEKQGSKPVTLIPADPGKLVKPTGGVTEISITTEINQALTRASSSANNTVGDPDQRSSSSNACASVVLTLVFSSCNLIFTASTSIFFLRVI